MAVEKIEKIGDGWNYKTVGWPNPLVEFTDVYRVTVGDPKDGGSVIETAFPAFGTPHPEKSHALLIEGNFDKVPNERFIWTGRLRYSSAPAEVKDNPLDQPVKRRWRTVKVMKPATKDRNGKIIIDKAGLQYDPPVEKPSRHVILQFTRNEPAFDGASALEFVDKISSTTFSGAPAGTLLIDDIEADEAFHNGASYWVVVYSFEYNPEGWQPEILEQSFYQIKNGERVRIRDKDGQDVVFPWPIDADGKAIPHADVMAGAAIATKWEIFHEVNPASLGLPA